MVTLDDLSMQIYDLENQNEALSLRIYDLERTLKDLDAFLRNCDLPYRVVSPWARLIEQKLERDISSYRV